MLIREFAGTDSFCSGEVKPCCAFLRPPRGELRRGTGCFAPPATVVFTPGRARRLAEPYPVRLSAARRDASPYQFYVSEHAGFRACPELTEGQNAQHFVMIYQQICHAPSFRAHSVRNGRTAGPTGGKTVLCSGRKAHIPCWSRRWIIGPSSMRNTDGKMKRSRGPSIFTGASFASFSARSNRCWRI